MKRKKAEKYGSRFFHVFKIGQEDYHPGYPAGQKGTPPLKLTETFKRKNNFSWLLL
jgi:hypothetical protein